MKMRASASVLLIFALVTSAHSCRQEPLGEQRPFRRGMGEDSVRARVREQIKEKWRNGREKRTLRPLPHEGADETTPGTSQFWVTSGGLKRSYLVHVPSSYDARRPAPVILNFHGGGADAGGHERLSQMDRLADREGIIAAYPRGNRTDGDPNRDRSRFWNVPAGPTGPFNTDPFITSVDDAAFANAVLNDLEKRFNVDTRRVYAAGFSNGAIFTHHVGCELSARIAAIAPVSGQFWHHAELCQPERPLSVLYFHGRKDFCAPFYGGPSKCEKGIASRGRIFPPVERTIAVWTEKNQCPPESRITYQQGEVTCRTYGPCEGNSEVTFCEIEGGGHMWPGGTGKGTNTPLGWVTNDINANDAMWEFFKRHSR